MRILVAIAAMSAAACASAPRGVQEAPASASIGLAVDSRVAPADSVAAIRATARLPPSVGRAGRSSRVRFEVQEADSGSLRRAMGGIVEAVGDSAVLELRTARPDSLVVRATAGVEWTQPVRVEFTEPELPPNACEQPEYMRTKPRPLDKMTDREFQAFLKAYEGLSAEERRVFQENDLACGARLDAEAKLERRKTNEKAGEESRKAVDRPFNVPALTVGIPVLAGLVWTLVESLR